MKQMFFVAAMAFATSGVFASSQPVERKFDVKKLDLSKDASLACCEVKLSTGDGMKGEGNVCAPTKDEAYGKAMGKALDNLHY